MKKRRLTSFEDDFLRFCWFSLPPSARARILAHAGKTTWLFGAGASHHYALNRFGVRVPLASGFFEAFNLLPTSHGFGAHIGPLISFLEHYKGVPPDRVSSWNENIENFMTSIESKLEELRIRKGRRRLSSKNFGDAWSYGTVFNNMNFIFANVLNESQNGASTSLYHLLLQTCSPNDSFLTFNWDTLLDRALTDSGGWNPQDGYDVSFAAVLDGTWKRRIAGKPQYKTNWKLLKLHGSTNWLVPYLGVNFQTLRYASIVPGSDRVFLYWYTSLPYSTLIMADNGEEAMHTHLLWLLSTEHSGQAVQPSRNLRRSRKSFRSIYATAVFAFRRISRPRCTIFAFAHHSGSAEEI